MSNFTRRRTSLFGLAVLALALGASGAFGQQTIDNSGAARVSPYPIKTYFPGACTFGDHMTLGTGTPGANDYACGSSNDWHLTGGSNSLSSPSLGAGSSPVTETWTVGAGGVSANTLVQTDASAPLKIVASTTGTYGVAMSSVSAAGSVEVARFGTVSCVADTGGATAGDLVILGTGSAIDCKDSGQTASSAIAIATRIIGVFRSTAIAGATALVELTPAHFGTLVSSTPPTCNANQLVAGPSTGSPATAACRAAVAADIPTLLPAVSIGGNAATATALAPGVLPVCTDAGGAHLNWTGSSYLCGVSTGGYPRVTVSWGPGTVIDGGYKTFTLAVPQAQLGQGVIAGLPVLPAGLLASMAVTASGVVTITLINVSGSSQTFGSALLWTAEIAN
jgi:hypothetical protein